jgi:fatty acid desaturase
MRIKMNSFEELENIWGNQKDNSPKSSPKEMIEKAKNDSEQVRNSFRTTMLILGLTCVGLLVYMLVYKTYLHPVLFACNSLMIGLLLVRIGLEWYSYASLKKVSFALTVKDQLTKTEQFYTRRKQINFVLTPIIFVAYWAAFYYLAPLFKANLSHGMYTYVMVSGVVLFAGLAILIYTSIKKEMKALNKMRSYLSSLEN